MYGSGTTLHMGNTKSSTVPSNCISGTAIVIPNAAYNIAYIEAAAPYGFSGISVLSAVTSNMTTNIALAHFDQSTLNSTVYSRIFSFSKFISVNVTTGHTNYSTVEFYVDIFILESYTT